MIDFFLVLGFILLVLSRSFCDFAVSFLFNVEFLLPSFLSVVPFPSPGAHHVYISVLTELQRMEVTGGLGERDLVGLRGRCQGNN